MLIPGDLRGVAAVGAVRVDGAGGGRADADHAGDAQHAPARHHPRGGADLAPLRATIRAHKGRRADDQQSVTTRHDISETIKA